MTVGQCLNLVDEMKQRDRNQVKKPEMNELTTPTISRSITTAIRQVFTTQESDQYVTTVKPTSSSFELKKLSLNTKNKSHSNLATLTLVPSTTSVPSITTTSTTMSTSTATTMLTTATTTTKPLTTTYVTTTEVTTPLDFICLEHTFISWDGFILTPEECHAARQVLSETSWVSQDQ